MADKYEILLRYFGYSQFRPGQAELIDQLSQERDVLGVMPTGAGKSICYQVPALMREGITLVISPLISLMRDQVLSLKTAGVPAAYINSSLTYKQFLEVLRRMEAGRYKLVYAAPERLALPPFRALCARLPITLVVVDEAHCISQWGQDFRPDYLRIADFLGVLPHRPPLGAFTATATDRVKRDIVESLGLRSPFTLTTGFDRPNLFFAVRSPDNKNAALLRELERLGNRSGIIYCSTRKRVESVCALLQSKGYSAAMYHAGLEPEVRAENQRAFLEDRVAVMVATNAFGMGIDKSNVSFVIHYNMPGSIEAYYQEAGRAGRDGEAADCVLFYAPGDVETQQFLIEHAEPNPDLTEAQQAELKKRDRIRLEKMRSYAVESGCLRAYILRYFGETPPAHCDYCSNCLEQADYVDITAEAGMILACIRQSGGRFGLSMIARILHGDGEERIRGYGLDALPVFGALKTLPLLKIRNRIRALLDQGYLLESGEYRILKVSPRASDLLSGTETVSMRTDKHLPKISVPKGKAVPEGSAALFEKLRQLRMEIAREERKAPFMVFSDATLRDMCRKMPGTREEFLQVSGVGETKARLYGPRFLALLRENAP